MTRYEGFAFATCPICESLKMSFERPLSSVIVVRCDATVLGGNLGARYLSIDGSGS